MKEITIFIIIMVLALVIFFFIEAATANGTGLAALGSALGWIKTKNPAATESQTTPAQTAPAQTATPEKTPEKNSETPKQSVPKENPEKENSGKINISITKKTNYHPSIITLNIRPGKEKINITGFKIKTRQGEFLIPQAVEKYQSLKNPKDIIISTSSYVYLIGAKSPLGENFRVNECFGCLKNSHNFYPAIFASCPKPKLEEISWLNPSCQDFILKLKNCQIPNYSNNLKIATDSNCIDYLNDNFNYAGCYNNHYQDENFLKNYWYIYTKSDILEPLHDIIYLYDKNGFLVTKYSY